MKQYSVSVPTYGWMSENTAPWGTGKIEMGLSRVTVTASPRYNDHAELKVALVAGGSGFPTGITINGKQVYAEEFFTEDTETGEQHSAPNISDRVSFS